MTTRQKTTISLLFPLGLLGGFWLLQNSPPTSEMSRVGGPSPVLTTSENWQIEEFESSSVGGLPQGWEAPRGTFGVANFEGKNVLEFQHEPMVEGRVLLPGVMPGGGVVRARIRGDKARRAFPRMAVGLTQDAANLQFRVLPGEDKVELVLNDQPLAFAAWKAEDKTWIWLELSAKPSPDGKTGEWEGRAWQDGSPRPEAAFIVHKSAGPPRLLRASLHLAPYALKSIYVNRVETLSAAP